MSTHLRTFAENMSSKSKTKVINKTGADVILKLSTGGIISKLSNEPLVNGGHYFISIDLTTTYREYWCAVQPNAGPNSSNDKVILNSDDCAEYSEVTLTTEKVPNGAGHEVTRYKWVGTRRRDAKKNKQQQGSSSASASTPPHNSASGSQVAPLNADRTTVRSSTGRPNSRCTIL